MARTSTPPSWRDYGPTRTIGCASSTSSRTLLRFSRKWGAGHCLISQPRSLPFTLNHYSPGPPDLSFEPPALEEDFLKHDRRGRRGCRIMLSGQGVVRPPRFPTPPRCVGNRRETIRDNHHVNDSEYYYIY